MSASADCTVKLFGIETGNCLQTFYHESPVYCVRKITKNKILTACLNGLINVINIFNNSCTTIMKYNKVPTCIEIISHRSFIICSSDDDGIIDLLNFEDKSFIRFIGHTNTVLFAVRHWYSDKLVSCSADKTIRVWDLMTGTCLKVLEGHLSTITCVQTISEKKGQIEKIISTSLDKTIKIWSLVSGECLETLYGHSDSILFVILLSYNKIASCSNDDTIKVWNFENGNCLKTIKLNNNSRIRYLIRLSKHQIVSCSDDSTISLWNIYSGLCEKEFQDHKQPIFYLDII